MGKQTLKQYWMAQVNHQIYMLGIGFPRERYKDHILPKLKTDTLKEFYHKCNELDMMRSFNEGNARIYNTANTKEMDWVKVRRINKNAHRKKLKLVKEILHG